MRLPLGLANAVSFSLINAVHGSHSRNLQTLEILPSVPLGWDQGERLPGSKLLKFRLAVKKKNQSLFEQHVVDISTPGHRYYGQHLSQKQLKDWLRPSADATNGIISWLESEGAQGIEDDGDWINFRVEATEAERMLDTKYGF